MSKKKKLSKSTFVYTMCEPCGEEIDWNEEETFVMEYRKPNGRYSGCAFFHPKCFISLASMEWAEKLGYKKEEK